MKNKRLFLVASDDVIQTKKKANPTIFLLKIVIVIGKTFSNKSIFQNYEVNSTTNQRLKI